MRKHGSRSVLGTTLPLLVFGTASALVAKVIYELPGPDLQGEAKLFRKPWFCTAAMFLGMALCLPAEAAWAPMQRWLRQPKTNDHPLTVPLLNSGAGTGSGSEEEGSAFAPVDAPFASATEAEPRHYGYVLIPCVFDLLATWLMSVGLLYVTISVFQMLRGVEVVFSALFTILFLGRPLNTHHWGGILVCLVGITLVGAASLLSGQGGAAKPVSTKQMGLGMALIAAAEAVQAGQVVAEEHFMSRLHLEPVKVVGFEGVFGVAIMVCLVLPALQFGPGQEGGGLREDSLESVHMLAGSPQLQAAMALSLATMALYNVAGMQVTNSLGAVARTVLETLRTLLVWALDLGLYYGAPLGAGVQLGEPWSSASWLQAVGFAVLVAGTLLFGRGEELQEQQLKRLARRRARQRWGQIRTLLPELASTAVAQLLRRPPAISAPMRPARIAGPARIRTALLPVVFVQHLQALTRPRWGSLASRPRPPPLSQPGAHSHSDLLHSQPRGAPWEQLLRRSSRDLLLQHHSSWDLLGHHQLHPPWASHARLHSRELSRELSSLGLLPAELPSPSTPLLQPHSARGARDSSAEVVVLELGPGELGVGDAMGLSEMILKELASPGEMLAGVVEEQTEGGGSEEAGGAAAGEPGAEEGGGAACCGASSR